MPTITGTQGDDLIISTQADDTVNGGDGNDTIIDVWGDDIIDGGDGDDVIVDHGGNNTIRGGAGNDRITISDIYPALSSTIGDWPRTNVVEGGTGNDYVTIGRLPDQGSLTVDLGDGNDILRLSSVFWVAHSLTLGAGQDTVFLDFNFGNAARAFEDVVTIADFTAGAGGDILNLGEFLRGYFSSPTAYALYIPGSNPFANGVLVLTQDGADTLVQVDYDGNKSDAILPRTILRLENVTATSLIAENFGGFDPGGAALSPVTVNGTALDDWIIAPPTGSTINGGEGNDEIIGSNLADEINGGLGNDILDGGAGDDILRGGDGDDLITDSHGSDLIDGGAGNDRIELYRPAVPDGGNTLAETVTVNAGDGNDYLRFEIGSHPFNRRDDRDITLIADLGAGDDIIELSALRLGVDLPAAQITLGAGRDRFILDAISYYYALDISITDFTVGNNGDILDLAKAIRGSQGWDFVSNPFATGHLQLVQDGSDTLVIFDYDGAGGGSGDGYHFTLVTLVGVTASTLTAANFNGYDPTGAASTYTVPTGTNGDDHLVGGYGAQTISGGLGNDVIEERFGGSDILRGGDGNDTIIIATGYQPAPANVTISADAGNDLVDLSIGESSGHSHSANINLGTGDDRLILRSLVSGGTTVTLGAGQDVIEFDHDLASQSLGALTIHDFATGAGGDRLDWNLFASSELGNGDPNFEPFVSGQARLFQSGANTLLQLRPSGEGTGWVTLATFRNTTATSFTSDNIGFDPNHPTQVGTAGSDTLNGTAGHDVIYGGAGVDTINGLAGIDHLYGDDGADAIDGGADDDIIYGGLGDDILHGGTGNDYLSGGGGIDQVFGDGGDDTIIGSGGVDLLNGGTGNDTISVRLSYSSLIDATLPAGSIVAGDGNDTVIITDAFVGTYEFLDETDLVTMITPNYTVDLGAGDDHLITDGHFGTITLGPGRDTVEYISGVDSYGSIITDFETGPNGDIIDLAGQFTFGFDVHSEGVLWLLENGADPFELGVYELQQRGDDVVLVLSPSISGRFSSAVAITFQNTRVEDFTPENFNGFNPQAVPNGPTYIEANTTIAAGQAVTGTNIVPEESVLSWATSHVIYDAGGSVSYVNNGDVTTIINEPGHGATIGFAVSRYSGPNEDAWFHNTATGNFVTSWEYNSGAALVSGGSETYGFYAPQQGVNFRNDGYFGVGAIDGYAIGVVNGFDIYTRHVINTGTMEILSNYGAIGVQLGPDSAFDNSGLIYVEAPVNAIGVDWRQYMGGSFTNSGTIYVINDPASEYSALGIVLTEHSASSAPRIIENSGLISADIAIWVRDTSPASPLAEIVLNTGDIEGAILLGAGNDEVHNNDGGRIFGTILLEAGSDLYDGVGGQLFGEVRGGLGNDTYRIDNADTRIIEDAGGGNDHVQSFVSYTLGANFEMLTLLGGDALSGTGNSLWNRITGNDGANILTGGLGNDTINGGGNIDTAVVSGNRAAYTVTQTSTGVFEVTGPDGTDTLTAVEYLQFDDESIRLLPGTGVSVTFDANDSSTYQSAMGNIRDFDGNALGGDGAWVWIGAADVNGDGDVDQLLVNPEIGRFATIGTAEDGLIYFDDHGWAGETRVAGIYIDPLVASGDVVAGSDHDSQRRFQNDLEINNINRVLGSGDYDGDGLQEVYFALNDGTAYLHAYMHADGNIRYANYQSEQQVIDFLTANGFDASTWAGWFPAVQEETDKGVAVMEPEALGLLEAAILNPAGEPDPMASFRFIEPQHEVFA